MFEQIPEKRAERWELLKRFTEKWCEKPFTFKDEGFSEEDITQAEERLGFKLPLALVEWYRLCGNRQDFWSFQDHFLSPTNLEIDTEFADTFEPMLLFCRENQNVGHWVMRVSDFQLEDPPVYMFYPGGAPLDVEHLDMEAKSLSEFALSYAFRRVACFGARYNVNGNITTYGSDIEKKLLQLGFTRVPFTDWHFPSPWSRFFEREDVLICLDGNSMDEPIEEEKNEDPSWHYAEIEPEKWHSVIDVAAEGKEKQEYSWLYGGMNTEEAKESFEEQIKEHISFW